MSKEEQVFEEKRVNETLVASIRFVGGRDEIAANIEELRSLAGPSVAGPPLSRVRGRAPDGGFDIEVSLPVSEPVEADGVTCETLPGGEMLCAVHRGPYGPPGAEGSIAKTWGRLANYMAERAIGWAEAPAREVYLEGPLEHGDDAGRYVTEIQAPLLLPLWLERLAEGLDRYADETVRKSVLEGGESIGPLSDPDARLAWTKRVLDRIDSLVEDPDTRRKILLGCAHRYPPDRIAKLRKEYERLGSVEELLKFMEESPVWDGGPFYREPGREPNVVLIDKNMADPEAYEKAADDLERRVASCFCPVVRHAIRAGVELSPTYCNCATGWFVQVWEGILGKPVRVEIEESVLAGDDRCKFAIYLPTEDD